MNAARPTNPHAPAPHPRSCGSSLSPDDKPDDSTRPGPRHPPHGSPIIPTRTPPAATVTNNNLIILDPAHGAADNGAVFADKSLEKDIDLTLANRIAESLKAKGFTVVLTRTNSTDEVAADARVDLANRSRPLACILVHAANGGHGVHLYTSALTPPTFTDPQPHPPLGHRAIRPPSPSPSASSTISPPPSMASASPLVTGRASVAPIDSLTCPAVALEIAPISANGDINTPPSLTPNYQSPRGRRP